MRGRREEEAVLNRDVCENRNKQSVETGTRRFMEDEKQSRRNFFSSVKGILFSFINRPGTRIRGSFLVRSRLFRLCTNCWFEENENFLSRMDSRGESKRRINRVLERKWRKEKRVRGWW